MNDRPRDVDLAVLVDRELVLVELLDSALDFGHGELVTSEVDGDRAGTDAVRRGSSLEDLAPVLTNARDASDLLTLLDDDALEGVIVTWNVRLCFAHDASSDLVEHLGHVISPDEHEAEHVHQRELLGVIE